MNGLTCVSITLSSCLWVDILWLPENGVLRLERRLRNLGCIGRRRRMSSWKINQEQIPHLIGWLSQLFIESLNIHIEMRFDKMKL